MPELRGEFERRINMTYIVEIRQKLQYYDTLILHFTDLAEAEALIETILAHADGITDIKITVELDTEDES